MTPTVSRRTLLAGTVTTAAMAGLRLPASAADGARPVRVFLFDGARRDSVRLARLAEYRSERQLDVAREDAHHWRNVRRGFGLDAGAPIAGALPWSTWSVLTGELHRLGWRARSETLVVTRHGTLVVWTAA